jgi:predicted aspartyl protease
VDREGGPEADAASDPVEGPASEGRWRTSRLVPVAIVGVTAAIIIGLVVAGRGDQGAGLTTLQSTTVDGATLPITLPFRHVAGHVVIDVTLGDDGASVPMILDTGAPTIVSSELAGVYGGEPAGTISTVSVDGQVTSNPVVPLPDLSLGGATFGDVGAVVSLIEPGNPLYCLTEAGFIGANLMQAAVWQIDHGAERLTIASGVAGLDHIAQAIRLDFERASDASPSPLISVPAGDGSLTFLVDTGSDGWLVVNPADLRGTGIEVAADAPAMATLASGASGAFATRLAWAAADVALGDQRLVGLPIAASDALPEGQGIMGNAFLDDFVVTIDWGENTLYLDPLAGDPNPDVPMSVSPTWHDGYVVRSVVEGTPGTAGIELDAPVLAIDGEDVTSATFDDFCRRSAISTGAPYEMTVGGDQPIDVVAAPVDSFFDPLALRSPGPTD